MPGGTPIDPTQLATLLMLLEDGCTATDAIAGAGMSPSAAYRHRAQDEAFRDAWAGAVRRGRVVLLDRLEAEADRRASEGVDEPVFHDGVIVGHKRRYSDALLMFRLKALAPDTYRERTQVEKTGPDGGPQTFVLKWGDGTT